MGSLHFCVMTITFSRMARGYTISVVSLTVLWIKLEIYKRDSEA